MRGEAGKRRRLNWNSGLIVTSRKGNFTAYRMKIIYSKGKKKKRVPTLFTTELNKEISYFVKHRDDLGVLKSNIY